ncbi:MAG: alanine--tRNA ligase [Planctomycetes bacterium]|nr:alanine--tRNA ligase [Planctomycetota bacterium]
MKTDEIRSKYLKFFEERGAKLCASDSLVPSNDPTLLFTGAGMNQFKDYFLGIGKMDFRRATSCQKCIRTGDIMNVGVTSSHHTFFEMLGNFSFGDYFKREAITWAWEFLTGEMKIPESKLQVSVHETDGEAFNMWKDEIGVPESRIFRLGDHDNFWPADAPKLGPNGPCGPCSEIFYDRGEQYGPGIMDITHDCRRWVEIWNLVFTQFDRQDGGKLEPLSQCNIDTGMGLERMVSCMQQTETNMDIDIFLPIVNTIAEMAEKGYRKGEKSDDVLMRRVADHARAVTFCIGDGVLPANSHRGYVLKRLLRRAVLDGRTLGIREAFMDKLVPVVAEVMKQPYPEIAQRAENIAATVANEESKFLSTLDKGLTMIDMAVRQTKAEGKKTLSGATAFELYDTYGFPYELAEEVVEKEGLSLDREGFEQAMTEAKMKAREGAKMKGDVFAKGPITEVKKLTGETEFLGYDKEKAPGKVIAIICGENLVDEAGADSEVTVVLDKTTFYGESGGQIGDTGILVGPGNLVVAIDDTQKIDGLHFHVGRVESGTIKKGMEVSCEIDSARRLDIRRNHTVTHLLHKALHEVVGDRAEQKGSYVAPDRMRFDFQHGQALTRDERNRVEELVNGYILENHPVKTDVMSIENAKKAGAMALFGEKYGDTVRVVTVDGVSTELCGGTHMNETAPIGSFRIINEESVSAGVRRIEALTGAAAYRYGREQNDIISSLSRELKVGQEELYNRIQGILLEAKGLRKTTMILKREQVRSQLDEVKTIDLKGIKLAITNMGETLGPDLADAADAVKRKIGDEGVAILAGADSFKVGIVVTVGKNIAGKRLHAGNVIKKLAGMVGGGGGGRPDMAQAGGKEPQKLEEMLAAAQGVVEEELKD